MSKKVEIEIHSHSKEIMKTRNGVVSEMTLQFAKENLLLSAVRQYHHIVDSYQHYPEDDQSEVELDLNIVILSKQRYDEMRKHEDGFLKLCN